MLSNALSEALSEGAELALPAHGFQRRIQLDDVLSSVYSKKSSMDPQSGMADRQVDVNINTDNVYRQ